MARSRNIKPALFMNEILGEADPIYTLLFAGLWTLADREGRLEDRPKRIKAELFPYRYELDVSIGLAWLKHESFINQYKIGDKSYIQINSFHEHQNPHHKEIKSVIPPEIVKEESTQVPDSKEDNQEQVKHGSSMAQASLPNTDTTLLIPDSLNLIPDSLNPKPLTLNPKHDDKSNASELFDEFWKCYPEKSGKANALKDWLKNKNHLDYEKIISDVELKKIHKWDMGEDYGKEFRSKPPNGSTYVHQQRWLDGYQPPKKNPNKNNSPIPTGIDHGQFEGNLHD